MAFTADKYWMQIREILTESRFVQVHSRLNPRLFKDFKLRPEVRSALLKIADRFRDSVGLDTKEVIDITLTGSNAAYTYTRHSDLDLHLIVAEVSDSDRELYDAKKSVWNSQHDIKIRSLPVELYVQGEQDAHHSNGVYSVQRDQWITEPRKQRPKIDDISVQSKVKYLARRARLALASTSVNQAESVKQEIRDMRRAGLDRAGEWSTENIAFKTLRNMGVIDRLSDHITKLEDQELSLEQQQITTP